jgi:hypothetical protein
VGAAAGKWKLPTPKPHAWKPLAAAYPAHTLMGPTTNHPTNHPAEAEAIVLPPAALTCVTPHDAGTGQHKHSQSPYWLAGDAAGRVLVYDARTGRVVRALETAASTREAARVLHSKTVIHYPNLVHAVAARGDRVVLWTTHELQALSMSTGDSLFVVPLSQSPQPSLSSSSWEAAVTAAAAAQGLDWHKTEPWLLWQHGSVALAEETFVTPTTGLLRIDCRQPQDLQWRSLGAAAALDDDQATKSCVSHAAVWDESHPTALLQVVATTADNFWELIRLDTATGQALDRTTLPRSAGSHTTAVALYQGCRIQQQADYIFLCTNRGIRCFDAHSLTFLTVYGETVALHGKTVGWQQCFWLPEPSWAHTTWQPSLTQGQPKKSFSSSQTATCLLTTPDELARRRAAVRQQRTTAHANNNNGGASLSASPTTTTNSKSLFSNMLLVGVPHPHRGPTELQSTLYVWKPGQVLPLTTLQAPAGGLLGVMAKADAAQGWHLQCATAAHGQAWEWRATLQSDFSGNMYPVHYQVIDENVEYLEDEDELDKNVVSDMEAPSSGSAATSTMNATVVDEDDLLQQALMESMQDGGDVDAKIDVLGDDENEEPSNHFAPFVPAWPDASLRPLSSLTPPSPQKSPSRFASKAEPELFSGFPQLAAVRRAQRDYTATTSTLVPPPVLHPDLSVADKTAVLYKAIKGKRSRTANVEVLLQATIDPALRQDMNAIHKRWSDGQGSRMLPPPPRTRTAEEKELALELLLLSPTSRSATPTKETTSVPVQPPPAPSSSATPANGIASNGRAPTTPIRSVLPPTVSDASAAAQPVAPSSAPYTTKKTQDANEFFCPACLGRMVFHVCGKRAKPVDVEALERAEQERREAEEAEKQRLKVEKRRAAEAKRREARKKKKEEDERQRREDELRKIEEDRLAAMQKSAEETEWSATSSAGAPAAETYPAVAAYASLDTHRKIPRYSELMSSPVTASAKREGEYSFGYVQNGTRPSQSVYGRQASSNVSEESTYSSTSFTPAAVEPLFRPEETTPIEPAYSSPSFAAAAPVSKPLTASDSDALAVLAGLADQSSMTSSWKTDGEDPNHYDYHGAAERRRAILGQYQAHVQSHTGGESYSVYDRPSSYDSRRYPVESTESSTTNGGGSGNGGRLYFNHHQEKDDA